MDTIDGGRDDQSTMRKPFFPGFGVSNESAIASGNIMRKGQHGYEDQKPKPASRLGLVRSATVAGTTRSYRALRRSFAPAGSTEDSTTTGPARMGHGSDPSQHGEQTDMNRRASASNGAPSPGARSLQESSYREYRIPIRNRVITPTPVSPRTDSLNKHGPLRRVEIGIARSGQEDPFRPVEMRWQPQVLTHISAGPDNNSTTTNSNNNGLSRSKSKWNPFSRSKSKRIKPEDAGNNSQKTESDDAKSSGTAHPQLRRRRDTDNSIMPEYRSRILRSNTESKRMGFLASDPFGDFAPRSPSWSTAGTVGIGAEDAESQRAPPFLSNRPFLNIDIPNIEMERYSVMFSGLLERKQTPPPLQARRQVKLDRLKVTNAGDLQKDAAPPPLPRRATSPLPKKSPTTLRLPLENTKIGAAHRLSPRLRSNTSPAMMDFPAEIPETSQEQSTYTVALSRTNSPRAPSSLSRSDSQRLISKFNRKESITGGVSARIDRPHPVRTTSLRHNLNLSRPPTRLAQTSYSNETTPRTPQIPFTTSPKQTPKKQPSADFDDNDDDDDKSLNEKVEISIARQVSVSRKQRKMIVPLNNPPRRPSSATEAAALVALGRNKRLVETKSSTPMVVHLDSPDRTIHRQSTQVVLDEI
ncbi:hypothetical protein PT974_00775 [Cladobotryum mycophilum]|uniref:Uncharacterized protein n=1 Tax=Cladobotryum mycophilum TaxID=491253 RepID=A0ABR0T1T2_9HYPO